MELTKRYRLPALSQAKNLVLLGLVRQIVPQVTSLQTEWCFGIKTTRPLSPSEQETLGWVLKETFEPSFGPGSFLGNGKGSLLFEAGPRPQIETPWSSSLVSALHACGLTAVLRAERFRRYRLEMPEECIVEPERLHAIGKLLYDRMTEQLYETPLASFDSGLSAPEMELVPLLENGQDALNAYAAKHQLGLSGPLLDYIYQHFAGQIRRNPTDVELLKLSQLWSNHCRHIVFKSLYVIDGRLQDKSLFAMIRSTTEEHPGNVLVAYEENSAVFTGYKSWQLAPNGPATASRYVKTPVTYHIIFKIETHNHPSLTEPFQGGATGTGGILRDLLCVGQGALPVAQLAAYLVGCLNIPGYSMPWENEYCEHPAKFETPLQILIGASNGASDYNNKFGQPLVMGACRSFEEMVGGEHYGYRKPVVAVGGWGIIDSRHTHRQEVLPGYLIIQLGGKSYPIGVGGGSGSSKEAGAQSEDLDFASVQRADAEMENREFSVFFACSSLGPDNPIIGTTDLGAGGCCVAWTEIAEALGAYYELDKAPVGDTTMSAKIRFCNESQERILVIVKPEGLALFQAICRRNRCPMAVVGTITGDHQIKVVDSDTGQTLVDLGTDFLFHDLPRQTIDCQTVRRRLQPLWLPESLGTMEALRLVLRHPDVCSKEFLVRKADQSVGNRVARQQRVGPLGLPLADCAVTASDLFSKKGTAASIGEQPIVGLVNNQAGIRMSVGEALTNLAWAQVEDFDGINLSATWQWPCGQPGEDARLYEAVRAAEAACKQLGLRIPVGKDSTSMSLRTTRLGQPHTVKSPGTVQFIACAPCPDITRTVTPDLKAPGLSHLLFIDLSGGRKRLGGSVLARAFNHLGDEAPDADLPLLKNAFLAMQELGRRQLILAGHDRSDGGLITCLLEMAFTGNCGLEINLQESGSALDLLFNQELGLVIEYMPQRLRDITGILNHFGLEGCFSRIGFSRSDELIHVTESDGSRESEVLSLPMPELRSWWRETSFRLDMLQANPEVVAEERQNTYRRKGMQFRLTFTPSSKPPSAAARKPKVAVLREEGTNGHRDLAEAFYLAGFETHDLHMTDLLEGRTTLREFKGLAMAGGFAYADVPESAKAWASVILHNPLVGKQFAEFLEREDTFTLGICNGCQLMALLGIVPWQDIPTQKQPRFIRNRSEIFEARFVQVAIQDSPSIFFRGMEGSALGIWVNHGEGRLYCPDPATLPLIEQKRLAPLRYTDDDSLVTEEYPFNPNGSPAGIAGLCTEDGRHLALMPHPERLIRPWQWPYVPSEWKYFRASPWLKLFQNAYKWCLES